MSARRGDRTLTAIGHWRERRRRERFWRRAQRHVDVLGVEDLRGNRFLVSTGDQAVGRELFVRRAFDAEVVDTVVAELGARGFEPAQVVDVGANIGTVTIDLLSRFPAAAGVAVEPDRTNFELLRQNLAANRLERRVTVHQAVVSDRDGSAVLELSADNFGDHRVRVGDSAPGDFAETRRATQAVAAWRLDTLLAQGTVDLDPRTLIWVDVQGHEAHVLAGAARFREVPTVIEVWPYGLRRAGGLERLLEQLASWEQVIEVRGAARSVPRSDLPAFFAELESRRFCSYTDVLLLPASLARS